LNSLPPPEDLKEPSHSEKKGKGQNTSEVESWENRPRGKKKTLGGVALSLPLKKGFLQGAIFLSEVLRFLKLLLVEFNNDGAGGVSPTGEGGGRGGSFRLGEENGH